MENIKVTYLPNSELQGYSSLLRSLSDTTLYDTELVNLHVLYNSDLDIDIKRSDSSLNSHIRYTDMNNLISSISGLLMMEDETVIVVYGYDLTLDDIRNNIFELVKDNEGVFMSINILCDDKDLRKNINFYLDSDNYSDDEWDLEKKEMSRIYEEDKFTEDDDTTIKFIYDIGNSTITNISGIVNLINETCDVEVEERKRNKISHNKHVEEKDNYICHRYEDYYNNVSVGTVCQAFFIEDDEGNRVLFDEKGLEFIIDILNKLSK